MNPTRISMRAFAALTLILLAIPSPYPQGTTSEVTGRITVQKQGFRTIARSGTNQLGQIASTTGNPRLMQSGLKVQF